MTLVYKKEEQSIYKKNYFNKSFILKMFECRREENYKT